MNVVSGAMSGSLFRAVYGSSKGAVAALTYGWALEFADTDIRVNGISPLAETAMSKQEEAFFAHFDLLKGAIVGQPALPLSSNRKSMGQSFVISCRKISEH